jgi:hypothetical protein
MLVRFPTPGFMLEVVNAQSALYVPTSDLNIVRSNHEVCTSDGAIWDQSRSVPALRERYYSGEALFKCSGKSPSCTKLLQFAKKRTRRLFTDAEVNTRTSVFPMTESGPGSGGAQTHQS